MSRSRWLPWILLVVWSAWIFALQGYAAHGAAPGLGRWVPDVGLVLLLCLAARLPYEDLPRLAIAIALGRTAVSVDPPVAIFAGYLAAVAAARAVRFAVELDGPLPRSLLAGACALGVGGWLALVHDQRVGIEAAAHASQLPVAWSEGPVPTLLGGAPAALTTALVALFFGPALAHLPGLTPLRKRRSWHNAVSRR